MFGSVLCVLGGVFTFLGIIGSAVYSGFPWFGVCGVIGMLVGLYFISEEDRIDSYRRR